MKDVLAKPAHFSETALTTPDIDVEEEAIDRAVTLAVREALLDHKRAGNPVAIWEDGKVKIVPPEEIILPEDTSVPTRRLSAREIFQLPTEAREQILAEQFAQAETFYRNDPELTNFDACDEADLYDEYPQNAHPQ